MTLLSIPKHSKSTWRNNLSQVQDGEENVICYYSKCLSRSERKYCTTRKELFSVVLAVKHFKHYLIGNRFTFRSDHGPLQWLMRFKNCDGQIEGWIKTLSANTLTIIHHAGRVHNNAYSMSCRPCYNHKCRYYESYEQRYSLKEIADLNAGLDDVTLPCIGGNTRDYVNHNRETHEVALPNDGTISKHINSVSYVDQNMDPRYNGPSLTDDNYSGRSAHTIADFRRGVAEVFSLEMTHGMTQIGDPHLAHTMINSECDVDAEAHKIVKYIVVTA